jgi:hypothetical protein
MQMFGFNRIASALVLTLTLGTAVFTSAAQACDHRYGAQQPPHVFLSVAACEFAPEYSQTTPASSANAVKQATPDSLSTDAVSATMLVRPNRRQLQIRQ